MKEDMSHARAILSVNYMMGLRHNNLKSDLKGIEELAVWIGSGKL